MDSEALQPSRDAVQCCDCGCSCSSMSSSTRTWLRSVKRKHDECEDEGRFFVPGLDYDSVARVQIENEIVALRETVSSQQRTIQDLSVELEEERNASASAANEAMSMILKLQREKAEIQMEARQFKRLADEKMGHDQQEISVLEDLLYKREQAIQSLTCEVQAYKHRMMSYGLTEAEADGEKGFGDENADFDYQSYEYPPLKCNIQEQSGPLEGEDDVIDVEKYACGETPRSRDQLRNLEYRIFQMERNPSFNTIDGDFANSNNMPEKVIVGRSPRKPRHSRRFSTESWSSLVVRDVQDLVNDSPRFNGSAKDFSNLRKMNNASESGDDMSDRICTIDSVHVRKIDPKAGPRVCDDLNMTPRGSLYQDEFEDPEVKKLYTRLQALEADRESMRQAIISMQTDKAQLLLLKEIAQSLCKDTASSSERYTPAKRPSKSGGFTFMSVFKWIGSFVFWKKKARRNKYAFGLSSNEMGLLMLLDKNPRMRQWRCLTSTQGRNQFLH